MDEALFKRIVKQVIKNEPNERDAILSQTDAAFLLGGGGDTCCSPRSSVFGYPSHPLYAEISNMLLMWIKTRRCPTLDLPSYNLLDEKHYVESRAATVQSLTPMLLGLVSLWDVWTQEEIAFRIRDVLKTLGRRGLLDLLGVRRTVGSADRWPVDRGVLLQSFSLTHGPGSELSVGARALAKHHHRDSSTSWWGTSTGTEKARNEHALRMMNRILDEASWINIHNLPGDLTILEVRQPEGYGVRWTADGSSFRGFVEPQMVGGHDVGWKH